jgi:hypothetical protein
MGLAQCRKPSAYLQPHVPVEAVLPQHEDFSEASQHVACSLSPQQLLIDAVGWGVAIRIITSCFTSTDLLFIENLLIEYGFI